MQLLGFRRVPVPKTLIFSSIPPLGNLPQLSLLLANAPNRKNPTPQARPLSPSFLSQVDINKQG